MPWLSFALTFSSRSLKASPLQLTISLADENYEEKKSFTNFTERIKMESKKKFKICFHSSKVG
jgi:hypothetical protein